MPHENNAIRTLLVQTPAMLTAIRTMIERSAELLVQQPGIWPEDVLINLVKCAEEHWSFGNFIASYAS
jgi:hypothetical protein